MLNFKHKFNLWQMAVLYGSTLFAAFGLVVFLIRAKAGINLLDFGDEAEKFVAAQMIGHGMKLYHDIFAHHGPVPYIISHLYTKLVSPTDFTQIRWVIVALALSSAASIYFSPALKTNAARMLSVGTYLSLLSSAWVLQGMHMVLYQPIGGFLLVIPTMQLFVPLVLGDSTTRSGLIISGFAIVVACFTSYTFGPSSVLLIASAIILLLSKNGFACLRQHAMPFALGIAIGLGVLLTWIFLFADLKGFFVYHFYFNQEIYSHFIGFNLINSVISLFAFSFSPPALIHALILVGLVYWLSVFAFRCFLSGSRKSVFWSFVSLFIFLVSVFFLNPRGAIGFQDSGFIIVNISLFSLICALYIQERELGFKYYWHTANAALLTMVSVFVFEQASRDAISSPHEIPKRDLKNHVSFMKPSDDGAFQFIRSLSEPEGDVLALIFNPGFYIQADRRPASGHYYYLPWQAAYNKRPVDGYKIDLCSDIESRRPSLIWFYSWKVMNKYKIEQYEPCVPTLIKTMYTPLGDNDQLFLRSDLLMQETREHNAADRKMQPSPQLSDSNPIHLSMTSGHKAMNSALKRIGVMFGTQVRQNPGNAELLLRGPNGPEYRRRFSLPELADNKYRYFDLSVGNYTSGEIVSVSGGGISTWESIDVSGDAFTCLTYEYADGKRRFTPGCPLF